MSEPPGTPSVPSPHEDTKDFVLRMRAGDQAAFQLLYERFAPALYAWTRLRIRGNSSIDVEVQDVLQEVWLRATRALESYDETRSFRRWILGIAKNVLLQGYRKASADPLRWPEHSTGRQHGLNSLPDSVTSISRRFVKDEVVQGFLAYVSELDSEDRALVLYCGLEGYTSDEAGARLRISADAVNKRWQTLRARMRENGTLRALVLDQGA